jgi:hypothetical protein
MPAMPSTTRQDPRGAKPSLGGHGPDAEREPKRPNDVDAREPGSVSSALTGDVSQGTGSRRGSSRSGGHEAHALVAVGPGLSAPMPLRGRAGFPGMNELRAHGGRIHRPLLRSDVLSRRRLNDWLDEAAAGRVVLVIAEAGFGKTTLLADWARHTNRLTTWYRLEPADRDWLT